MCIRETEVCIAAGTFRRYNLGSSDNDTILASYGYGKFPAQPRVLGGFCSRTPDLSDMLYKVLTSSCPKRE